MSKSIVVIDTPCNCGECMFMRHVDDISIGKDFLYKRLYRCMLEPEGLDEDEGDIVYINQFIFEGKPPWCQLRNLPEKKDNLNQSREIVGYNKCLDEILGG